MKPIYKLVVEKKNAEYKPKLDIKYWKKKKTQFLFLFEEWYMNNSSLLHFEVDSQITH